MEFYAFAIFAMLSVHALLCVIALGMIYRELKKIADYYNDLEWTELKGEMCEKISDLPEQMNVNENDEIEIND